MNGWIKLYRSTIENPKLTRAARLSLWVYILLSVNHYDSKAYLCGKEIALKAGQGVFSTPDLSKKLGVSVSVIRRSLDWLESEQQIEQQKTTKGTVITVLNWGKYQECEQQNEQQENNKRTTREQQENNLPIIKEYKELKNDKNNINNTNVLFVEEDDYQEPQTAKKYKPIIDAWNSLPLPNIRNIQSSRLKMLNARIKEYGMDDVLRAIDRIRNSSFLLGQSKTNWQISFDWFIRPNNFVKVLEGNYDDRERIMPTGKNDVQAGYNRLMEILGGENGETN